jgi:molybdate transport system substrate-binding protein
MKKLLGIGLVVFTWLAGVQDAAAATEEGRPAVTVFAAASLTNVLQELGDGFTKDSSVPVRFSFAASSALARQIENGSRADVFFSADLEWMDYLQARNLIQPATRRDVLGNELVLIAPVGSKVSLKIAPHFALAATLGKGRLATGDPDSVPAGRYAHEALANLGVWDAVSGRLVRADSVRSALAFVERGEAPLGIVYATDALIDKDVRVVDVFPAGTHMPIIYPAALTMGAKPDAARFLAYIRGPAGGLSFRRYGFKPLNPD